ncbi:MAG: trypsin-like peptidase domain-containing protein, partial [Chloroflexi bacterium]|nr:trypsin-like peptidase domain-containing protein [Chloroflexota bacterium]
MTVPDRLVEVWAADGAGQGAAGSGWIVGEAGVLTAFHVVRPSVIGTLEHKRDQIPVCQVRAATTTDVAEWCDADVVWTSEQLDIALLKFTGRSAAVMRPNVHSPLRIGGIGDRAVECEAVGFPESNTRPDGIRQPDQPVGTLMPAGGARDPRHRIPFDVSTSTPDVASLWQGMSGGAVRDRQFGQLFGIVVAANSDRQQRRLFVVALEDILAADGFRDQAEAVGWRPASDPVRLAFETSPVPGSWMPPLPLHFVPRDDLAQVTAALNSPRPDQSSSPRRIALVGMGGAGKTVLATQIARDSDVRSAFPDGVWWLDLTDTLVLNRQTQFAKALGDPGQLFSDWQQGRDYLAQVLVDRAVLLILDNVRHAAELDAFDVLGPRGCLVFTTRDAGLAAGYGAAIHEVGLLPRAAARTLLARAADLNERRLPRQADDVLQHVGGLPLALAMAGAMVRGHADRWSLLLTKLQAADVARIAARLPGYPHPNLLAALDVGIVDLNSAGIERGLPDAMERYLDLAVFAGRGPVPASALAALWSPADVAASDVEDYVALFVDRSIIVREANGHVWLHELLQAEVISRTRARTAELHARLVRGYAKHCASGWASGPNDGFFFENLLYHLVMAGRVDEAHKLALDIDWLWTKLRATDLPTVVAD